MAKKIAVDTDRKSGQLFRVSESDGTFYIYRIEVGLVFDDKKKLGEADTLADALEIIKASVPGRVTDIRISEW